MAMIEPHGFTPRDVSLTLTGSPQQLVAANMYRSHLQFQCVAGNIYYSFTNAACAAGLTGCYLLGQGQTYMSGATVPNGVVYVNGTNTQLLVATEC